MTGTSITMIAAIKILTPIVTDLYKNAKDEVKKTLAKWATDAGIKNLASQIVKIDKVKTVWSPEKEISLKKFYYPSKLISDYHSKHISSIKDLPDGNLVIEGIVGQGKSIFMRHLAISALDDPHQKTIPAFIELRNINSNRSLIKCIFSFLDSIGVQANQAVFDYLASSEKLVLILDGFDEVPNDCINEIIYDLQTLNTKHKNLKIIISSRPKSHIQYVSGYTVLKLEPLTLEDYEGFVSKLIPLKSKRSDILFALEGCAENIKGVIHTPLMLTLLVMIYQTEKEIPATLSAFFDKLFTVVFSKHDKLKAGFNRQHHTGLSEGSLKKLFEVFCFIAVGKDVERSMSSRLFDTIFSAAQKYDNELKCKNEHFREDIIKVACLMLEEGIDTITFLHRSILDYHAAAFVRDLTDLKAMDFYSIAFNNYDRWKHALNFLRDIDTARYAKEYILKSLKPALKELSILLNNRNPKELIKFFEEKTPKTYLMIGDNELKAITSERVSTTEFHFMVHSTLYQVIDKVLKHLTNADITRLSAMSGAERIGRKSATSVPLSIFIREFGEAAFFYSLTMLEQSCSKQIEDAQKIVDSEEKKDNFLEKIFTGL